MHQLNQRQHLWFQTAPKWSRIQESFLPWPIWCAEQQQQQTGPHTAVSNVSGYRSVCVSDCNSRGREFDPGPVPYFVEIVHEVISTVILLPSADSFKKGCCQLQAKVCAQITG